MTHSTWLFIWMTKSCLSNWLWQILSLIFKMHFLKSLFFYTDKRYIYLLLCWKTRIVAPDPLAPLTMEQWFRESLIIKPPCILTLYTVQNHLQEKLKKHSFTRCSNYLTAHTYLPNQDWKDSRVCYISHAQNYRILFPKKVCNMLLQFFMQYSSACWQNRNSETSHKKERPKKSKIKLKFLQHNNPPPSTRLLQVLGEYLFNESITRGVQYSSGAAKPR